MTAADVIAALTGVPILIDHETAVQRRLAEALGDLPLEREVACYGGRIDFLERPEGLGIEVKIKGNAREIHRQIVRYSLDPRIHEILLITAKAMGMPPEINGKPITIFSLGRAHL
jgi:predicted AAA+ superfamily ATPase